MPTSARCTPIGPTARTAIRRRARSGSAPMVPKKSPARHPWEDGFERGKEARRVWAGRQARQTIQTRPAPDCFPSNKSGRVAPTASRSKKPRPELAEAGRGNLGRAWDWAKGASDHPTRPMPGSFDKKGGPEAVPSPLRQPRMTSLLTFPDAAHARLTCSFAPHLARRLILAQADEDGVTKQAVVGPSQIGDLGDELGPHPMDF